LILEGTFGLSSNAFLWGFGWNLPSDFEINFQKKLKFPVLVFFIKNLQLVQFDGIKIMYNPSNVG
jgi:hypothetical protein